MASYRPELLEDIRARVDIVELVGQFVNLKRAGANWKGLCPFHQEKSPSFTVHPKKGIFHCFGCGVGGDAFAFLMRQDRLPFPDAVKALAERAGVELPADRPAAPGESRAGELQREVMKRAAAFYVDALWAEGGARAREYLERRGVDPEVARRFGLGWAPEGWDNLLSVMRREPPAALGGQRVDDALLQAGLVLPRQTGPGHYDRFRGRLIFPIRDVQGRTIAFGGRALGAEEPKYLNSPETSLYVKGQQLYGLDLARTAMRDTGRAIVVEGYLDCLMAHQYGFAETVAALGTAFTPAQLGLLRRHSDEVITVFDADAAGQKAAARAEEMVDELMGIDGMGWSVSQGRGFDRPSYYPIRVAILPAGDDPDSLLRTQGAEAFRSRLAEARSILSFVMAQALAEEDLSTERGRATAHARAALLLSKVSNAEEATTLSRQAARELGVDPTQLWIEARQLQGARARQLRPEPRQATLSPRSPGAAPQWPSPTLAERDLLALLLHYPEARGELLEHLDEVDVAHPGLRELLAVVRRAPERPAEALMSELESEAARGLLASLLIEDRTWSDIPGMIVELRRRYEIRGRKRRLHEVTQSIVRTQAESGSGPAALDTAMQSLQRQAREVRELTVARAAGSTPATPPGPAADRVASPAVPTPPPTDTP